MHIRNKLQSKVSTKWAAGVLALALIAAVGVSALIYADNQNAKESAKADSPKWSDLRQIDSILRDDSIDAQNRIDEALKILDQYKQERLSLLAEPEDVPLPTIDPWNNWTSPFQNPNWTPFREMQEMRRNMDRLFGDVLRQMDEGSSLTADEAYWWSPQGGFEETDDAYIYRFDLPGVDKGEVSVTIENGQLTVEGSRESKIESQNEDEGIVRREIRHGHFRRSVSLPSDVDLNAAAESSLENGVLTITLPKQKGAQKSKPKTIEVR